MAKFFAYYREDQRRYRLTLEVRSAKYPSLKRSAVTKTAFRSQRAADDFCARMNGRIARARAA